MAAEASPESSRTGIIVFTLWYIFIAFNYYMGWLPNKEIQEAAVAGPSRAAVAAPFPPLATPPEKKPQT